MTPPSVIKMFAARWFIEAGVRLFPIKQRDKVPACPSWDDYQPADGRPLDADVKTWANYGVVLGLFAVLDTDTPESEAWVAEQLQQRVIPTTPFTVTTARGLHRYYRLTGGAAPHFIHRAGHTIEFRNAGQYVVGPGSVHASGHVYTPADWRWDRQHVPFFPVAEFDWDDRPIEQRGSADGQPLILPPTIHAGERHDLLFKLMRSLQACGIQDVEQLLQILRAENAAKCVPPIDDAELSQYIRRVARYKDRPDFTRAAAAPSAPQLAGTLVDKGASLAAALAAARALQPSFDPSGTAPVTTTDVEEVE